MAWSEEARRAALEKRRAHAKGKTKPLSRSQGHAALGSRYGIDHPLVREYISEAEHQDGYGYWKNFKSPRAVLTDFRLYVRSSDRKLPPTMHVQALRGVRVKKGGK